jgi:hypothetical protein
MHAPFPQPSSIGNLPASNSTATNQQTLQMLQLNNLLDPSDYVGTNLLQNPIAQFLPDTMPQSTYSFAFGGGAKKKSNKSDRV